MINNLRYATKQNIIKYIMKAFLYNKIIVKNLITIVKLFNCLQPFVRLNSSLKMHLQT
jgi:hypothetical protein